MPHPLLQKLLSSGPVLTDGAWGTELQARGLPIGEMPDLWNLTHPEKVSAVAQSYVEAGSRIILTNTFGANRSRLAQNGFADRAAEINKLGVQLSRAAAGDRALVFASIGPSGKAPLSGEVGPDGLYSAFTEQAEALAAAGADGLVLETMYDLAEAKIAVRAAKSTGLPIVACMVFNLGKGRGTALPNPTPEQAATVLVEAGADVLGANCGCGITGFIEICARLKSASGGKSIWIKPNAGLPRIIAGKAIYDATPQEFAAAIPSLINAGANFIGGCCGTTPAFIRAISTRLISRG